MHPRRTTPTSQTGHLSRLQWDNWEHECSHYDCEPTSTRVLAITSTGGQMPSLFRSTQFSRQATWSLSTGTHFSRRRQLPAVQCASQRDNKLLPPVIQPFPVISSLLRAFMTDERDTNITVSIERATCTPQVSSSVAPQLQHFESIPSKRRSSSTAYMNLTTRCDEASIQPHLNRLFTRCSTKPLQHRPIKDLLSKWPPSLKIHEHRTTHFSKVSNQPNSTHLLTMRSYDSARNAHDSAPDSTDLKYIADCVIRPVGTDEKLLCVIRC